MVQNPRRSQSGRQVIEILPFLRGFPQRLLERRKLETDASAQQDARGDAPQRLLERRKLETGAANL